MKFKMRILAIMVVLLLGAFTGIFMLYANNQELKAELSIQIKNQADFKKRDSLYTEKNKKYSEVITKYVTNCTVTINGKEVTLDEFIKLYTNLSKERNGLYDSVYHAKMDGLKKEIALGRELNISYKTTDSLYLYKHLYEAAKAIYGVDLKREKSDKGYVITQNGMSKADSASVFYRSFKPKLKPGEKDRFVVNINGTSFIIQLK